MPGAHKGPLFSLPLCSALRKACKQTGEGFSPVEADGLQSSCRFSGLHQPVWLQPSWEGIEFTHRDVMRADNCAALPCEADLYVESGRFVSDSDTRLPPHCGRDHLFCSRDGMHSKHPVSGGLRPSHQFPSTAIGHPQPAAPNQILSLRDFSL